MQNSENHKYEYPLCVPMASMNISIKREAYDLLKQMRGKGMSFSDVILGFRKQNKSVMRFFGALKDVDWDAREKRMKEFRDEFDRRLE